MKFKWIAIALVISLFFHIGVLLGFGKIHISLPSFYFIETFILSKEKKPTTSPELNEKIQQESENVSEKNGNSEIQRDTTEEKEEYLTQNEVESLSKLSEEKKTEEVPVIHNNFKKFINEKMRFDIYWMGIYAGYALINVKGNEKEVKIISEVHSAPFISNFYYVNDKAESTIEHGKPKHFRFLQIEGKHRGDKEIHFNYDSKEITFINHIKNKVSIHKGVEKVFMDVLSGFFYLRSLSIELNKPVLIDIFDSDKFATVEVKPIKEEVIETSLNKEVKALVVKPELTTEGLFKRKGDIFIWLSNDERKIPLRVETKVSVGRVVAELKEYKKD
ncbi:MAG: DUF3108 domain-containing protein [Thermodesulfovibrio sp.]|uniref:DUF3108 domain-containing protein n=1 Tax=unclassified Thermodesulfovibrio TaxID=2645936 RepID=UPI0008568D0A|nr:MULTISPECIES: DUF3108 domain-containing protein [unclassified Thermodesulfovibrio]MDI1472881.1 DUF3108 domain-containing protein [Thermodesulfovibrio sp. 1176]MDI6714878.1 DUF3108 domain-containing protein [Thermodesulfovibrio sp.]ODA44736.1 ATP-dependent exoDNAse (exonuclease V) alpha subunit - helicase superfamily I member [Thermodesulfovibrio sp. N1]